MASVLAIDFGTRRCGFAVADGLRLSLQPLAVLEAPGDSPACFAHLAGLLAEREVDTLLVGLPRHMDGREAELAPRVRAWIATVQQRHPRVRCLAVDERLSSKEAEELLREEGLRGPKARALRDSYSALVLLRDWIAAGEPR